MEAAETRPLAITRAAIVENGESRAAAQQALLSLASLPMSASVDANACEQSLASIVDKRIHAYSTAKRASGEFQGYVVVSVPDEIYLRPLNRAAVTRGSALR